MFNLTMAMPNPLHSVARVRSIEQRAMQRLGHYTLMQRAGRAVAKQALAMNEGPFLVLAGPGNNGGDAFEAAAYLCEAYRHVEIVRLNDTPPYSDEARLAYQRCVDAAIPMHRAWPTHLRPACVIDGLFGIGLARPIDDAARVLVEAANACNAPIVAIDIPSGIDADTGAIVGGSQGTAIRAHTTLTFIADKPGLHTGRALDYVGEVKCDALGCEAELREECTHGELLSPIGFVGRWLRRDLDSHKGRFGVVTIIGGDTGMAGAAVLAARAALLSGAGRVVLATLATLPAYDVMHPELMLRDAQSLASSMIETGPIVIGPGLGHTAAARALLDRVLNHSSAAVLDADALNLLAHDTSLHTALKRRAGRGQRTLLTPHPLEAARLLETEAHLVQADRIAHALRLAAATSTDVALKGAGTVIASTDGRYAINPTGNPALATGGTGDVLAGIAGALLAVAPAAHALRAAVWLHGSAADALVASGVGPIGLAAGELMPEVRRCLNRLAQQYSNGVLSD
ncbi:MAG TPA: NAD(P)H-hydrate dehydratase [Burkholderiaceae bacterium]|nr:NAD(P)H-hydrate dehydratase [Burkholderiaceae bacterium]